MAETTAEPLTGMGMYACSVPDCDRSFPTAQGVNLHVARVHTKTFGAKKRATRAERQAATNGDRPAPKAKRKYTRKTVPNGAAPASARRSLTSGAKAAFDENRRLAAGMQVLFPKGIHDTASMLLWVDLTRELMNG